MYGRTVNSHTFMERSANHSTKGSRRGFVDVGTGVNPASLMTPAQLRDNLQRRHDALRREREAVKAERGGKEKYQQLGQEMFAIQTQMGALNAKIIPKREHQTFDARFVQCAKSMLITKDFERISEAARRGMLEDAMP